jgi:hypothetical protein
MRRDQHAQYGRYDQDGDDRRFAAYQNTLWGLGGSSSTTTSGRVTVYCLWNNLGVFGAIGIEQTIPASPLSEAETDGRLATIALKQPDGLSWKELKQKFGL